MNRPADLPATRIECDEIWAFCYTKARNVPEERRDEWGLGDVWTWVVLDPDTKLICSWLGGRRDGPDAMAFLMDLAPRLRNRVQITTDGHKPYIEAIEQAFGKDVDYAMLIKEYGRTRTKSAGSARPWSCPKRSVSSPATPTRTSSARAMWSDRT